MDFNGKNIVEHAERIIASPVGHTLRLFDQARFVLAVRDHVRAEVIAQVREWAEKYEDDPNWQRIYGKHELVQIIGHLHEKLDELEGVTK